MVSSIPDLEAALDALPLFPLPEVVLFPEVLLPLHVFEPRYRAMVRDVLATHRALAVVQIADVTEVDAEGNPKIERVAGAGVILHHQELPGGRFNILVKGVCRVELDELPFEPPYRRARARVLPSDDEEVSQAELAGLVTTATRFASIVRSRERGFEFRLPKATSPGAVADACAHHLLVDGRERQRVLETRSVRERVRRVSTALAAQALLLSGEGRQAN
jgi:Lon protease-like protein